MDNRPRRGTGGESSEVSEPSYPVGLSVTRRQVEPILRQVQCGGGVLTDPREQRAGRFRVPREGSHRTLVLRGFRLPKTEETALLPVTLTLRPSDRAGEPLRLVVQTQSPAIEGVSLRPPLQALATEPLIQEAKQSYGRRQSVQQQTLGSHPLQLELRLRGGRLTLQERNFL